MSQALYGIALGARTARTLADRVGFDPTGSFPGHLGLSSMRERAGLAQAEMTINSEPGAGATVTVRLRKDGT